MDASSSWWTKTMLLWYEIIDDWLNRIWNILCRSLVQINGTTICWFEWFWYNRRNAKTSRSLRHFLLLLLDYRSPSITLINFRSSLVVFFFLRQQIKIKTRTKIGFFFFFHLNLISLWQQFSFSFFFFLSLMVVLSSQNSIALFHSIKQIKRIYKMISVIWQIQKPINGVN
jgi:hypothetical protein